MSPCVVLRTTGHAGFQQQAGSRDTSSRAQMDSALARRESSVYLGIPCPSCAGWHLPSQQGQPRKWPARQLPVCHNPAAVLIYLTGPGSKWGRHKSCSAGPGRWAETSKHGAGGTSWVPSDARSQPPTAPAFPQTNVEPLGRDCFHCVLKPHCRPPSPALQRFSSFAPR